MALITGGAGNEKLTGSTGPDTIYGGAGNDRLIGLEGDDVLFGETGDDQLLGKDGDDRLYGEDGADRIAAGAGDDSLFGGAGVDNLIAAGGNDYADGGAGDDLLRGGAGDDVMYGGSGGDRLLGNGGADILFGDDGEDALLGYGDIDFLFGGGGADRLRGGGASDFLYGGAGDDRLAGDGGDDVLNGGAGENRLLGGSGDDIARYEISQGSLYVVVTGEGTATATDLDGTFDDRLSDIETVQVSGAMIALGAGAEGADLSSNPGGAAAMAVGTRFTGEIGAAGDEDWIAVTLMAGVTYQIELLGADSGNGTLADPYLGIFDADGFLIAENDDSGLGVDSNYIFRPAESGLYFLSASSFFFNDTGSYTLSVTAPEDDFPGTLPTDNTLAIGESATGEIQFDDDLDLFAVELIAGARYTILVRGADAYGGTLDDPFVSLLDAKGNTVAADDDGGVGSTSRISYTATETGAFYIEVDTDDEREYGTYTVSIVQNTAASTAADLMALAGSDQPEPQDGPAAPQALPGWAALQASIVNAHLDDDLNPVAAVIHSEPGDWF